LDKIRIKSGLNQDKIWIKGHGRAFSIGPVWRNLEEMCQKWILEPLLSEIYMKMEVFSILKHNSTSAPIAHFAEHLTFFI
jgi:hypothetical protein